MEDTVRKLCLTLAASLAVLSTSALPSRADGVPSGAGTIDRGIFFEEANRPALQLVHFGGHRRYVCTHFWNGRWHRREVCFWITGRRHHRHHYNSYGHSY
jgi:hypothetical protein